LKGIEKLPAAKVSESVLIQTAKNLRIGIMKDLDFSKHYVFIDEAGFAPVVMSPWHCTIF
jgi:hypothetical protein